ncbi:TonB-dependent receptor [Mucilaginibacter gynuensis]
MKKFLFIFLMWCIVLKVHGQSTSINGKVLDDTGQPLIGAVVKVNGESAATATSSDGVFTLKVINPSATLTINYVGFETKEVPLNGSNTITVTLAPLSKGLQEVVVVGYGTQKKVSLTGAVASIAGKDIVTTKNENVFNSLTGKIPGLNIAQKSSEPGSFNTILSIRGSSRNPLIIIDGVPRGSLERLDPNDIDNISVLKDASAAIYGVRAADGVILVTTKSGKKGKTELTYTGNYGVQRPVGLERTVDAIEYMTLMNEKFGHSLDNPVVRYTEDDFNLYRNGTKITTDWYTPVLDRSVPQNQHNITATGGSESSNYFLSLGHSNQKGFWKSGDLNYEKYNLRSNVTAKIAKGLTAEMRLSGLKDTKNQPWTDTWVLFKSLFGQLPLTDLYANNNPAYPGAARDDNNPLVTTRTDKTGYKRDDNILFQGSVALNYEIPFISGLNARVFYSYDYNSNEYKGYQLPYDLYTYDPESKIYSSRTFSTPMGISRGFSRGSTYLMQFQLNYNRSFGKHTVGALALYEETTGKGDNFNGYRELAFKIDQLFAGNSSNQTATQDVGGLSDWARKAVVGRVNYDFNSRYLATFSFRYDGSSRFRNSQQWGLFPSAELGWRVSEESFFKNSRALSAISNFKIRGSYGKLGNEDAVNYQFLSGYNFPSGNYLWNGELTNGLADKGLPNTNITWYTYTTSNIGIDLEIWKGLLGVQVDAFRRDGKDLLGNRLGTLPGSVGADLPQENINSDRTQGLELNLTHRNVIGGVGYSIGANIGYARTKLRYQEVGIFGNAYENWRNNPNNRYNDIWWGLGYEGQFQSYDEIYNSPVNYGGGNRGTLPGDYKYTDWNEDGVIDGWDEHPIATRGIQENDVTQRNIPKINYGINVSATYKGVDLSMLWQGAALVNVDYPEMLKEPLAFGGSASALKMFMDRWHPEVPGADIYNPNTKWIPGYYAYTGTVAANNSERAVQNASYLRLKSLEIGYTFPLAWTSKIGIKRARFYLNGYNLVTFTGIRGLDPEHTSDIYGYTYPMNKTYNAGINISF